MNLNTSLFVSRLNPWTAKHDYSCVWEVHVVYFYSLPSSPDNDFNNTEQVCPFRTDLTFNTHIPHFQCLYMRVARPKNVARNNLFPIASFAIYLIHFKFVDIKDMHNTYYLGLSGELSLPFGLLAHNCVTIDTWKNNF